MHSALALCKCTDSAITISRLVQDLTMNDQKAMPDSHDDQLSREPGGTAVDSEAAMTQEVLRAQQERREGESDLELSAVTELE
jgi:hypothetical protein